MRLRRTHANQVEQSAEGAFVENRVSIADAFPIELPRNTRAQPNVWIAFGIPRENQKKNLPPIRRMSDNPRLSTPLQIREQMLIPKH